MPKPTSYTDASTLSLRQEGQPIHNRSGLKIAEEAPAPVSPLKVWNGTAWVALPGPS